MTIRYAGGGGACIEVCAQFFFFEIQSSIFFFIISGLDYFFFTDLDGSFIFHYCREVQKGTRN